MKSNEKPILFSSEMVRAILEGKKTQTRRVMKHQPEFFGYSEAQKSDPSLWGWRDDGYFYSLKSNGCDDEFQVSSPWDYCDRLWVKETFADTVKLGIHALDDELGRFVYKATNPDWSNCEGFKWSPSIFMPRIASRIILDVVDVRPERLQDISEKDAIAEGIKEALSEDTSSGCPLDCSLYDEKRYSAKWGFKHLWQSINGKKHPWDSNPWVWVIKFKLNHENPS